MNFVVNYTISMCPNTMFFGTKQENEFHLLLTVNDNVGRSLVRKLKSKSKHKLKDSKGKEYPVNLNINNIKKFHTLCNLIQEKKQMELSFILLITQTCTMICSNIRLYFAGITFHIIL